MQDYCSLNIIIKKQSSPWISAALTLRQRYGLQKSTDKSTCPENRTLEKRVEDQTGGRGDTIKITSIDRKEINFFKMLMNGEVSRGLSLHQEGD